MMAKKMQCTELLDFCFPNCLFIISSDFIKFMLYVLVCTIYNFGRKSGFQNVHDC